MSKNEILAKLQVELASFFKVPKEMIVPEANLINDLGVDSLDIPELVMSAEDWFDIDIPCDAAERIRTVNDLIEVISSQIDQPEKEIIIQRPVRSNQVSEMLAEPMKRQFVSVPG
ncbi:MAG: acyl carrier protein [bacterium]|nr:acyl carrier protein [bacterium]